MPKPPPRSSSGIDDAELVGDPGVQREHPAGGDLEPRGVEDLRADVAVQPEQPEPGAASTRRTASNASPAVIEKPNFWSSCAVAMYSWVCASTPAVTRTITGAVAAGLRGERVEPVDLVEGVDDDPADPDLEGAAQLRHRLVVAVEADAGRVEAGTQGDGELAAGADVEAQALLGDPPRDGRAEERLAGVVDVVVGERLAERARAVRGSPPRRGRTPGCRARGRGRGGRRRR